MRRFFAGFTILALGVFLNACELRAEISVNDDGTGTMGVVFAAEPEMLALMQQGVGSDPFEEMRKDLADDPVPWKVVDFREGNLTGIHATFPFSSIDDLLRKANELNESSSETGIDDLTLKRDANGGWVFKGTSTDVSQQSGEEFPIPAEQLATLVKLQFRVTLPGKAASSNATSSSTSGGRTTFVWKPSINDRSVAFHATTTPGGGGIPILPIALGAAVIGVAVVVGILRGRKGVPPADETIPTEDVESVMAPPTDPISP